MVYCSKGIKVLLQVHLLLDTAGFAILYCKCIKDAKPAVSRRRCTCSTTVSLIFFGTDEMLHIKKDTNKKRDLDSLFCTVSNQPPKGTGFHWVSPVPYGVWKQLLAFLLYTYGVLQPSPYRFATPDQSHVNETSCSKPSSLRIDLRCVLHTVSLFREAVGVKRSAIPSFACIKDANRRLVKLVHLCTKGASCKDVLEHKVHFKVRRRWKETVWVKEATSLWLCTLGSMCCQICFAPSVHMKVDAKPLCFWTDEMYNPGCIEKAQGAYRSSSQPLLTPVHLLHIPTAWLTLKCTVGAYLHCYLVHRLASLTFGVKKKGTEVLISIFIGYQQKILLRIR